MLAQILIVFRCSADGPSWHAAHYLHLLYQQARTARCRDRHGDEGDESLTHQTCELLGRVDRVFNASHGLGIVLFAGTYLLLAIGTCPGCATPGH